jgi:hypothetical protein
MLYPRRLNEMAVCDRTLLIAGGIGAAVASIGLAVAIFVIDRFGDQDDGRAFPDNAGAYVTVWLGMFSFVLYVIIYHLCLSGIGWVIVVEVWSSTMTATVFFLDPALTQRSLCHIVCVTYFETQKYFVFAWPRCCRSPTAASASGWLSQSDGPEPSWLRSCRTYRQRDCLYRYAQITPALIAMCAELLMNLSAPRATTVLGAGGSQRLDRARGGGVPAARDGYVGCVPPPRHKYHDRKYGLTEICLCFAMPMLIVNLM